MKAPLKALDENKGTALEVELAEAKHDALLKVFAVEKTRRRRH